MWRAIQIADERWPIFQFNWVIILFDHRGWTRVEIRTDSNYVIDCIYEFAPRWRDTADNNGNWYNARGKMGKTVESFDESEPTINIFWHTIQVCLWNTKRSLKKFWNSKAILIWFTCGHIQESFLKMAGIIHISKKMDDFSRNRSNSPPEKLTFENIWMSFPRFANMGNDISIQCLYCRFGIKSYKKVKLATKELMNWLEITSTL